jgi:hypothetical protein
MHFAAPGKTDMLQVFSGLRVHFKSCKYSCSAVEYQPRDGAGFDPLSLAVLKPVDGKAASSAIPEDKFVLR